MDVQCAACTNKHRMPVHVLQGLEIMHVGQNDVVNIVRLLIVMDVGHTVLCWSKD